MNPKQEVFSVSENFQERPNLIFNEGCDKSSVLFFAECSFASGIWIAISIPDLFFEPYALDRSKPSMTTWTSSFCFLPLKYFIFFSWKDFFSVDLTIYVHLRFEYPVYTQVNSFVCAPIFICLLTRASGIHRKRVDFLFWQVQHFSSFSFTFSLSVFSFLFFSFVFLFALFKFFPLEITINIEPSHVWHCPDCFTW